MINTILPGVNESLVVERNGKLVALVKFRDNVLDWNQQREDKFFDNLQSMKQAVLEYVNKHVSKQSKIGEVEAMKEDFEKTATHKIRRFKYKERHRTKLRRKIPRTNQKGRHHLKSKPSPIYLSEPDPYQFRSR